jgi:hypothetical protein
MNDYFHVKLKINLGKMNHEIRTLASSMNHVISLDSYSQVNFRKITLNPIVCSLFPFQVIGPYLSHSLKNRIVVFMC